MHLKGNKPTYKSKQCQFLKPVCFFSELFYKTKSFFVKFYKCKLERQSYLSNKADKIKLNKKKINLKAVTN